MADNTVSGAASLPRGDRDLVQLLTPEGERVSHPDYASDLDAGQLRSMYRDLVLVRRFDTEATALQRQGELGIWVSLLGQEAAQIGSGRALARQDFVFPTYREHGVAWCRNVDPVTLLGLYRGVNLGGWDPNEHNFHLYTIVIGAQTLHATGYAMGIQRDGAVGSGDPDRDAAVIAYFGDGATAQGDVNEAFVFASVFNAPVVFFCQNNQWAISEPNERQTRIPLYRRAAGFGFPGVRVDGNDVLAVHAVTRVALDRARRGEGPTFIEAFTYRMGAHTTSDDPTRYRIAAEVEEWKLQGPDRPAQGAAWPGGHGRRRRSSPRSSAESDRLAAHVRAGVPGACPTPTRWRLFENVYREPHPLVPRRAGLVRRLPRQLRGPGGAPVVDARGCPVSQTTIAKAINRGLRAAMENDPKVLIMGEDVGKLGGVFRVTDGLQKDFGEDRVIDTPLAESGIIGTGDRPRAARLPAGLRDPVRRVHLPRLRPDRLPARQDGATGRAARSRCRSSSGCPSAAASVPSSTTARAPRRTSPTSPGCASSRAPTRPTRTG